MDKLNEFEAIIGVKFKDIDFLKEALTHRSYLNEVHNSSLNHNERLEFLGDAVLELVVTEYLFKKYNQPEGILTNWRAALVNAIMLAEVSSKINLNDYVLLSRGEARDTGRARQYILANAMEAVIGAVYLDQGYQGAKTFIDKFVLTELPDIIENKLYRDAKSLFQEEAQDKAGVTPTYEVLKEWGPDHNKTFEVGVFLGNQIVGTGEGASKQEAQQTAAEDALKKKKWGSK